MLLDDLWDYLTSSSGGVSSGKLFIGQMPAEPAEALAIQETGGVEPIRAYNPTVGSAIAERPRVQVVSRAADYETARANIHTVWQKLENLGPRSINGRTYFRVAAVQSPTFMRQDENDRLVLTCNFDVTKQVST